MVTTAPPPGAFPMSKVPPWRFTISSQTARPMPVPRTLELPYVKQKFYKGSSKARGSGIGLAVCDEIVNLHGGTFDIGNAEGGGAVVTIKLPLKEN